MLKNPFNRLREDYCTHCDTNRSVECYDSYGNPIRFSLIVDLYYKDNEAAISKIANRSLDYFKCTKCNILYKIDWNSKDRFPRPLRDHFYISQFIRKNYSRY